MGMNSTEADYDDPLMEDKPFSPMYPVFNFGAPPQPQPTQIGGHMEAPPPAYGFSAPEYNEKKGLH